MEQHNLDIFEKYSPEDPELTSLWENHILFEKQIEKLEAKAYKTPAEEEQMKQLKKQKLEGKTRLHAMLDSYRQKDA